MDKESGRKVSASLNHLCLIANFSEKFPLDKSNNALYPTSKLQAYIGMGFADRSDSFDLNVALQDHFKGIKRDIEIEKENDLTNSANGKAADMGPKLNLAFKEGQTIRINIPKNEGATKDRTSKKGNLGPLPPPPGGIGKIAPPPSITSLTPLQSPSEPLASSVIGKHITIETVRRR